MGATKRQHTAQKHQTTLLGYVVAYLQEEVSRLKEADWEPSRTAVKHMVTDAINAYEGGAR